MRLQRALASAEALLACLAMLSFLSFKELRP